jgi:MFS transporter, ACS family, pantothenate transporter
MALGTRLKDYLHTDYQPGERVLVQKIDFFILTFCCLSYFTNYVSCFPPLWYGLGTDDGIS